MFSAPYPARGPHLAEDIHRLRSRNEDRVAVMGFEILRQRSPLESSGSRRETLRCRSGPVTPDRARPLVRCGRFATSPDAVEVVEPARASASMRVIPPVNGTGPG